MIFIKLIVRFNLRWLGFYIDLLKAVRAKDASSIFSQIKEFYDAGGDLVQLARGVLDMFRYLLLFQCADDAEKWADLSKESADALRERKNDFSRAELLLALALLQNLQVQLRRNIATPRLLVETAFLKLLHLDGLKQVADVPQPAGGSGFRPQDPVRLPSSPAGGWPAPKVPSAPVRTEAPRAAASMPVPSTAAPQPIDKAAVQSGPLDFTQVSTAWPRIIEYVKSQRMSVGVFLSEAEPVDAGASGVVLGLPAEFQFHKDTLEKDAHKRLVEDAFEAVLGVKTRIHFVITEIQREENTIRPSVAESHTPAAPAPAASTLESGAGPRQDIIDEALNVFKGARLVRKE